MSNNRMTGCTLTKVVLRCTWLEKILLNSQERKHQQIRTTPGTTIRERYRPSKDAKIYILELAVEGVVFGDDYAMSPVTLTCGNQEKIPTNEGKQTITCCTDNLVLLVAVTNQTTASLSGPAPIQHDPARAKPVPRKK